MLVHARSAAFLPICALVFEMLAAAVPSNKRAREELRGTMDELGDN
jgi:hypothetical protein